MHAYWRAANYLSVGQIYLMDNPLLKEPLQLKHVKPRLLGHWGTTSGPELPLRSPEPGHQGVRPEHALHLRPGARRAGAGGQRLPGRDLQRGLPQHRPGRGGPEAALHAVLVPRRHPQPRRPGDARLDPRRRRAGLRPVARLRRGLRQPRPDRRLRRRRRRGRDRAAGHRLARQQVPQPGPRRLRAAHPAPERLQDRQPHGAGPHQPRGAGRADARLRLHALFRRGRRPGQDAPAPGANPRPSSSARSRPSRPTPASNGFTESPLVADDRFPQSQGLDRPEGSRWPEDGRLLALAPGADGRHGQAGARADPRNLDEELQAGRAVRRDGPPRSRNWPNCRPRARSA